MSSMPLFWQRTNLKVFAFVGVAGLIAAQAAFNNYAVLSDKATKQRGALSQLQRWKAEYEVLRPFQEKWESTLPSTQQIQHIHSVYTALRLDQYGLTTDQERFVIKTHEPVTVNDVPLHANRVCVNTSGETGLAITAPHFSPDLIRGIDVLLHRHDIEVTNIVLSADNGAPKAVLDLCLIFRT